MNRKNDKGTIKFYHAPRRGTKEVRANRKGSDGRTRVGMQWQTALPLSEP